MAGRQVLALVVGVQIPAPQLWRVRLGVRTPASQAGNTGSNPVRATNLLH